MTLFLPILASLTFASPQLGQLNYDTMVRALSSEREASVHLELFVAPDREILGCRALHVEPSEVSVERLCTRLTGKKVASSASDPNGQPAYGVSTFVFTLNHGPVYRAPPDFSIVISDVPGDAAAGQAGVALFVEASGSVTDCRPTIDETRALAELACPSLIGRALRPRQGKTGEAVAYVDVALVQLVERQRGIQ